MEDTLPRLLCGQTAPLALYPADVLGTGSALHQSNSQCCAAPVLGVMPRAGYGLRPACTSIHHPLQKRGYTTVLFCSMRCGSQQCISLMHDGVPWRADSRPPCPAPPVCVGTGGPAPEAGTPWDTVQGGRYCHLSHTSAEDQ